MTDSSSERIAAFQKWILDLQRLQDEKAERERRRRAALTPEQRAAEDRQRAQTAARIKKQKILRRLASLEERLRKTESWTLNSFAWLLLGESPDEPDSFGFFDSRSARARQQHRSLTAILESCVGLQLKPIEANVPIEQRRFSTQSLLAVAKAKRLAHVHILSELMGSAATRTERTVLMKNPHSLAQAGTASRERGKRQRQDRVLRFARSLVQNGEGTEANGVIRLRMRGIQFYERFTKAFPSIYISPSTLTRDRRTMKPRIEVLEGRPPGAASL